MSLCKNSSDNKSYWIHRVDVTVSAQVTTVTYMHQSQPSLHSLRINFTVHLELWPVNHLIWCNATFTQASKHDYVQNENRVTAHRVVFRITEKTETIKVQNLLTAYRNRIFVFWCDICFYFYFSSSSSASLKRLLVVFGFCFLNLRACRQYCSKQEMYTETYQYCSCK